MAARSALLEGNVSSERGDWVERRAGSTFNGNRCGGDQELLTLQPGTRSADCFQVAFVKDMHAHRIQCQEMNGVGDA